MITKIDYEALFINDPGADSFDTVELIMMLEEEFDIEIKDPEAKLLKLAISSKFVINKPDNIQSRKLVEQMTVNHVGLRSLLPGGAKILALVIVG